MGDPVRAYRPFTKEAELESYDLEDDFRAPTDNPIDPGDTFEVLIRNQLKYDPGSHKAYSRVERPDVLYILDRSKYCERSQFFREALEEIDSVSSDPNSPQQVILAHHALNHFAAYMNFVETGSLDMPADDVDDETKDDDNENGHPLFSLLRMYVLADQLGDFTLGNLIINDIMKVSDLSKQTPTKKEIWFVWEMIEEYDHPLKKLFVDYQIHEAPRDSLIIDEVENIPFEYLNDVVLEFWDLAKQKGERRRADGDDVIFGIECSERPKCYYHQHDLDENHLSCEELGI